MTRYLEMPLPELVAVLAVGVTNLLFLYALTGALLFLGFRRPLRTYRLAASPEQRLDLLAGRMIWFVENVLVAWFPLHYAWLFLYAARAECEEE